VLLVTFSQATLYDYNHIYLQNAVISGRLTPQHGVSSGCGWRKDLQCRRYCIKKVAWTADRWTVSSLGLGKVLTTPHC